jgi:hypothetical protein
MGGKALLVRFLPHGWRVGGKMRCPQGLLDIDFQPLNSIGRGRGVGKAFVCSSGKRVIVEFDEKARHREVELQAVVRLLRQNLVWMEEQLVLLRNHPGPYHFYSFRNRQDDAGRKGASGCHCTAKHHKHPWIIVLWPDRQA